MCLWIKISSLESCIPLFLFHDGVLLMPCISDLCHNEAIASWLVLFLLPVGCNVQNMKVVLNLTSLSPDCGIFLGKMSYELYRLLVWLVFFHVFSLNKCWFCSGGKAGWLIELLFLLLTGPLSWLYFILECWSRNAGQRLCVHSIVLFLIHGMLVLSVQSPIYIIPGNCFNADF